MALTHLWQQVENFLQQKDSDDALENKLDGAALCLKSSYAEPSPDLPPNCPGEPAFTTYLERVSNYHIIDTQGKSHGSLLIGHKSMCRLHLLL